MGLCIYTGADDSKAEFRDAEHIFPKCIGGTNTLPLGSVSDEINKYFSKLELGFARQYPPVVISRMFSETMGRKKHKNRDRVGIVRGKSGDPSFMLGFVREGSPHPLDQLVFSCELTDAPIGTIPLHMILGPSNDLTRDNQLRLLWKKMKNYNGSPTCVKSAAVPPQTYLLGAADNRWYLGISERENPEIIKPKLSKIIARAAATDIDKIFSGMKTPVEIEQQVEVEFSFSFNYLDILRVYAKTAVNCLAAIKGCEFVMNPAFDELKQAILTGENITSFVTEARGPNPIPESLRSFPDRIVLGSRPHCAVFFSDPQGDLIAFISLFGTDNPMAVRLGKACSRRIVDFYLCDWEHHMDYTMNEFVLKVCRHDEPKWEPFDSLCE